MLSASTFQETYFNVNMLTETSIIMASRKLDSKP